MQRFVSSFLLPVPARRFAGLVTILCAAAWGLAAIGGCGGGGDDGALLARVGEVEIHVADYEDRLATMEENELPRGDRGRILDMAQPEGKQSFLTTLVNKELMVAKAHDLGYDKDDQVQSARNAMLGYEANVVMAAEVLEAAIKPATDEDYAQYYERLGETRICTYLYTNYEKEAAAAREAALSGMDWRDVVQTYHESTLPESGELRITVPYGRYDPEFEAAIFATESGGFSEPIETAYGWWVVRVESVEHTDLPSLEEMKPRIDNVVFNRQKVKVQSDFRAATREKHNVYINEEALWKVYQGLPELEELIDIETNEPVPVAELAPLNVAPVDLDMEFFAYDLQEGRISYTVADYKDSYDEMTTFARPKKQHMVSGLRNKIQGPVERAILNDESKQQGYYEHPDVLKKIDRKLEEIMVTNLYHDLVVIDERVTPDDLENYWAEHADDFAAPEVRSGRLVIVADAATAATVRLQILDGALWKDVVDEYGTDKANQARSGKLSDVGESASGPVAEVLFTLEQGVLSEPFDVGDGRFALVRCEEITPRVPTTLGAARERVGAAVLNERKEAVFQDLLADWAEEIGVVRYDEKLDEVRSWKELTGGADGS